jgi:hypothetical protein
MRPRAVPQTSGPRTLRPGRVAAIVFPGHMAQEHHDQQDGTPVRHWQAVTPPTIHWPAAVFTTSTVSLPDANVAP